MLRRLSDRNSPAWMPPTSCMVFCTSVHLFVSPVLPGERRAVGDAIIVDHPFGEIYNSGIVFAAARQVRRWVASRLDRDRRGEHRAGGSGPVSCESRTGPSVLSQAQPSVDRARAGAMAPSHGPVGSLGQPYRGWTSRRQLPGPELAAVQRMADVSVTATSLAEA